MEYSLQDQLGTNDTDFMTIGFGLTQTRDMLKSPEGKVVFPNALAEYIAAEPVKASLAKYSADKRVLLNKWSELLQDRLLNVHRPT